MSALRLVNGEAPANRLPRLGHQILRALYAHRLLSTTQVQRLLAPGGQRRWPMLVLAQLEERHLIARAGIAGSREFCWYLTPRGVRATEGPGVERRPYRVTAGVAVGPLQAHTLATNAVGLSFVEAAAERGDECDVTSWRNETAHRIDARTEVITDAVLEYTMFTDTEAVYLVRFVEVDRGTTSVRQLVDKIAAYRRLAEYSGAWRRHYSRFPPIVVVMTGEETRLERRMLAFGAQAHGEVRRGGLTVLVTTLAELEARGPFARIFNPVGGVGPVDVLGG